MAGDRFAGRFGACVALVFAVAAGPAAAQQLKTNSYNLFGVPGLLDMPTAEMAEDGELAGTVGNILDQQRSTLTFQLAPRLTGSFRYAKIPRFDAPRDRFDRSFDVRYLLLDEGRLLPAVAIGLQDFVGTGVYSGEYVVATKELFEGFRVTAGLGWGRLGSSGSISDGFGVRSGNNTQTGGNANFSNLFRGPIAPFGGLSWQVSDKLAFKAEYSSDGYTEEVSRGLVERETSWNIGLDWEPLPAARISAAYMYGGEFGIQLNLRLNPKERPLGPGNETAPVPIVPRPDRATSPEAWGEGWAANTAAQEQLRAQIREVLAAEGIRLEALAFRATAVELRIANGRFAAESQAIGRTARILTRLLPASVESFTIVPVALGVPNSAVTLRRTDLERLENRPATAILDRAVVTSGERRLLPELRYEREVYPRFDYAIGPYSELSLFDPDQPVRGDIGLQIGADLVIAPGLELSGTIRKRLIGNLDEITRRSNSQLERVRSDFAEYLKQGDPRLESLVLAYYNRPATNLYGRVSAGLLERMYGGVSAELLWKPVDSRLALGLDISYVQQRDFEGGFGFQDYTTTTGHLAAYYDFRNGYHGRVEVGRYLAGDFGASFTVDREFDNGWLLGAYATFTDVPFEEFGEGSFDKGIRFRIPFDWFTAQASRQSYVAQISPLTRDGGARLNHGGRLYERVRGSHEPFLEGRSGRFWK